MIADAMVLSRGPATVCHDIRRQPLRPGAAQKLRHPGRTGCIFSCFLGETGNRHRKGGIYMLRTLPLVLSDGHPEELKDVRNDMENFAMVLPRLCSASYEKQRC